MSYLIYLRKSRADKEAEARGEGETLSRHEQTLSELAEKMGLPVGAVYREIVSGETISSRPKMQLLLLEVMQGKWEGVLVMEIERLARGDTKDQGTVAEAFKFSDTKIITPLKVYDPQNEYDEEYFEFNLFMSRREYKTINRRIQRGRIAAFRDGWYVAGVAPYGYEKIKNRTDKGYTLKIKEEEARVVRMIYDLYTKGELQEDGSRLHMGSYQIQNRLNDLCIPTRSGVSWSASSVLDILQNPIYSGYQRWNRRKVQKSLVNGQIVESRPKNEDCLKIKGRFEAIITVAQYDLAQKIRAGKPKSSHAKNALQNPLSGLIYCAKCGMMMARQLSNTKDHYPVLRCPNRTCDNVSSPLYLIEQKVMEGLGDWIEKYELDWPVNPPDETEAAIPVLERSVASLAEKLERTDKQLESAYNLLEQQIYTIDVFQDRLHTLKCQKAEIIQDLEHLQKELSSSKLKKDRNHDIPAIRHVIDVYWAVNDVYVKNFILRSLLERVEYLKTERNKKGRRDAANFSVHFYPRIPESR